MSKYNIISKWNRASELFRTQQFILNFAKEDDLAKIEEVIKKRREELAKRQSKK
ncbi:hypothetical protein HYH11_00620 [Lactobacillus salivarius]|uniref:Uncharacterized protein n=1 Tax=Ligilactobacillus salivarius TaxID=1624 RepID=A0A921IEL4_9LACO|nr:hypothetical protein [Ligilactobacillus salivarius]MDY2639867.1 hypothetical protein [Ligilactobacillus salivarius]NYA68168.1 hypothetical protein [Ligilactobacillus salivarius]NYA72922.1 hypothetical protein [Ligilactobacillus salivarius]UXI84476.1 hypothetical protein NYZ94_10990 [Ligilactobacillus salivarius]WII28194.1 hypothetical protein QFE45_07395 [Ligilactobacillus salivarius]